MQTYAVSFLSHIHKPGIPFQSFLLAGLLQSALFLHPFPTQTHSFIPPTPGNSSQIQESLAHQQIPNTLNEIKELRTVNVQVIKKY